MQKLNVTITDEQKALLNRAVASGRFASASEIVRDGLRLFSEQELLREAKLSALQGLIQEGIDSGPAVPFDMEAIRAEAGRRLEEMRHRGAQG